MGQFPSKVRWRSSVVVSHQFNAVQIAVSKIGLYSLEALLPSESQTTEDHSVSAIDKVEVKSAKRDIADSLGRCEMDGDGGVCASNRSRKGTIAQRCLYCTVLDAILVVDSTSCWHGR